MVHGANNYSAPELAYAVGMLWTIGASSFPLQLITAELLVHCWSMTLPRL